MKEMKKALTLGTCTAVFLLCAFLLFSPGSPRDLSGTVTGVVGGPEGGPVAISLVDEKGKTVGILLEDASFFSPEQGWSAQDLLQPGVKVTVTCAPTRRSYPEEGGPRRVYEASLLRMNEFPLNRTLTLSDGAEVELFWSGYSTLYRLSDGSELLLEKKATGPRDVFVGGMEGFDDLNETAQGAVEAYYEEQGLLYDVKDEAERAYQDYLSSGDIFQSRRLLSQDIFPVGYNDTLVYFCTEVTTPLTGKYSEVGKLCAAFDRETGRHIPAEELFTKPPEEVRQELVRLTRTQHDDPEVLTWISTVDLNALVFHASEAQLTYSPQADNRARWVFGFSYEDLSPFLSPWAVPVQREAS